MKSIEYISLSACTMMLTALGIDIMLPALGELRQYWGLSPDSTATSNIIVFFFMGQVAQLIFGILSDRFGRLPILRIGFPLYIIGGIVAIYAHSLEEMCAARFVAGMGSSAVFTTTIAGVRDRYKGDQMARTMSFIFAIFLFTPIFAPFLGMAILSVASWRAVFLTPPLFAGIIFFWSLRLKESLSKEDRSVLNWTSISSTLKKIISNKTFIRYTTISTLLFTALSSYVSSSEHMVGEIYGRPQLFPRIFAAIGLTMALCSLFNSRLTIRYGAKRAIRLLLLTYTILASILLLVTIVEGDPPDMLSFFIGIGLLMAINLAIEPNSSALALEPMGHMAGMAASVSGTIFFFVGSSLGAFINQHMKQSVLPLVISFFVFGSVGLLLAKTDKN